jgi:serine/threonine-protein kinase
VRDELDQLYFEQLVRQHDDGTYVDRADGGRLSVQVRPGVALSLRAMREQERCLVIAEERPLPAATPGPDVERIEARIPAGRYLLEAREGAAAARYPFGLRPGAEVRIEVGALAEAGADEAYVPAGPALLGESQDLYQSRVPGVVDVGAVFLALRPVSFADYLGFLEAMALRGDDAVAAVVPRGELGLPLWRREAGIWHAAPALARFGAAAQSLPAFGMSAIAAEAYATWLSEQRGATYRLPYDREWEKAARGTDGRLYPWGDQFDPTFCKMRASRPGQPVPEASGTFATDVSPYGLLDMAGGVADWTLPDPAEIWGADATDDDRHVFSRGGAWCDWPADCRVTARRIYRAADSALRVGFRLARVVG